MAIYKRGLGFELGTTKNKASKWPERDWNPGPPDCESNALTSRPRCLLIFSLPSSLSSSSSSTLTHLSHFKNFKVMIKSSVLCSQDLNHLSQLRRNVNYQLYLACWSCSYVAIRMIYLNTGRERFYNQK